MSVDSQVDDLGSFAETYSVTVLSANTSYQLARAPWPSPVNKKMILLNMAIMPQVGAPVVGQQVGCQVSIWDQDLSNSTPPTRGSAGGAVLVFGASGSATSGTQFATSLLSENQCPEEPFIGGIALQASAVNVNIAATVKIV